MTIRIASAALAAITISGCGSARGEQPKQTLSPIGFVSRAAAAGVDFELGHKGRTPLTILETAGGGCAFLDYNQDSWPDILLVGPHNIGLYRNRKDGTFDDVTEGSGLRRDLYWMGCAVGDYDGDRFPDIFLTGYRCFALYRNLGGARFRDVTNSSGITGLDWTLSAAFADLNGDSRVDLYVPQYLRFDEHTPQICEAGPVRFACGPEIYKPLRGRAFMNQDGSRFRALPAGDIPDTGKTWGVLASDLVGIGKPSIYLANDMMPCDLWTRRGAAWRNDGPATGTAYDIQGHLQGAMGVDSGDYNNDGRLDLIVTTYFAQQTSLYRNDGGGLFTVTSGSTGIGPPTMPYVGFGTGFADLDNDGWLDVVIANGHVRENISAFDASQSYAQPIQLFRGDRGRFVDCTPMAQTGLGDPMVGRGLSLGDYNRDGRLDILICDLEGKARLLENRSPARHWLDIRLVGPAGNRLGLGSRVTLKGPNGTQTREIKTCGSVLSALDPVAHFGLGDQPGPVEVTVRWPNGREQKQRISRTDSEISVRAGD